jgi:hypothetical protein
MRFKEYKSVVPLSLILSVACTVFAITQYFESLTDLKYQQKILEPIVETTLADAESKILQGHHHLTIRNFEVGSHYVYVIRTSSTIKNSDPYGTGNVWTPLFVLDEERTAEPDKIKFIVISSSMQGKPEQIHRSLLKTSLHVVVTKIGERQPLPDLVQNELIPIYNNTSTAECYILNEYGGTEMLLARKNSLTDSQTFALIGVGGTVFFVSLACLLYFGARWQEAKRAKRLKSSD